MCDIKCRVDYWAPWGIVATRMHKAARNRRHHVLTFRVRSMWCLSWWTSPEPRDNTRLLNSTWLFRVCTIWYTDLHNYLEVHMCRIKVGEVGMYSSSREPAIAPISLYSANKNMIIIFPPLWISLLYPATSFSKGWDLKFDRKSYIIGRAFLKLIHESSLPVPLLQLQWS